MPIFRGTTLLTPMLIVPNKSDVGLGNCDNTSDMDKPVSTAQQEMINHVASISGLKGDTGPMGPIGTTDYNDLSNKPIIPTTLSNLIDDATHRLVTDTDKSVWNAKQDALGFTAENIANKGSNNGYAGLDAGGKVELANLPSTLLIYKGVWNATTNTPTLTATDVTKAGFVYNVSVIGTQFGIAFKLGDWAIYNDLGIIEKSDNSDDVTSVNGQQGTVVLNINDLGGAMFKSASGTFASGGTTYTVTDAFVTANTQVIVSPTQTKLGSWSVSSAAGSFTITSDTTETATVTFDWGATK